MNIVIDYFTFYQLAPMICAIALIVLVILSIINTIILIAILCKIPSKRIFKKKNSDDIKWEWDN